MNNQYRRRFNESVNELVQEQITSQVAAAQERIGHIIREGTESLFLQSLSDEHLKQLHQLTANELSKRYYAQQE